MAKRYVVRLTEEERVRLEAMGQRGRGAALTLRAARALLKADAGWTDVQIAEALEMGVATLERLRKRAVLEGVEAALTRRPRPALPGKLDGAAEAQLIALACSARPAGRGRWTLRLLADRLMELKIVESIRYEAVRQVLKKKRVTSLDRATLLHPSATKRRVRLRDGGRPGRLPTSLRSETTPGLPG